jgi:glycosyltransferase involved in cell wall biosynthesis
MADPTLSALIVVHNEEDILADCLERLTFADEIVVVLDRCTDASKEITERFTDRIIEGAFELQGDRRNTGIDYCRSDWILEIDADEWVPADLAQEIRTAIASDTGDYFDLPVKNHIGKRYIRYGMGSGGFGKESWLGALFRNGRKRWDNSRLHPSATYTGTKGPMLTHAVLHFIDRDISDVLDRLDRKTTARAKDIIDRGQVGSFPNMVRKIFSRFYKCYVRRKAYKEGGYGFLLALCTALEPVLAHLKATLEEIPRREAEKAAANNTASTAKG